MARIAGVDIPRNKQVWVALQYIHGVGPALSQRILAETRIAVIGLGNELMADDGVGIHAIRRLQGMLPPDVPCLEIGTAALRAETVCRWADVIVAIDAVAAGSQPGSVYILDLADAAVPRAEALHGLSLAGLIDLLPPDERPRVLVVGVEPARLEYALALSGPVEGALLAVVRIVREIVGSAGKVSIYERKMRFVHEEVSGEGLSGDDENDGIAAGP